MIRYLILVVFFVPFVFASQEQDQIKSNWHDTIQMYSLSSMVATLSPSISISDLSKKSVINQDQFIFKMWNQIQIDISKGSGESLNVLSGFHKCSKDKEKLFHQLLQKNYDIIYKNLNEKNVSEFKLRVNKIINSDQEISRYCSIY